MKTFSEYSKATGLFTSQIVCGMQPDESEETAWISGRFNHLQQRVDVQTGRIVDYAPAVFADDGRERRRALALIADLERRQLRPLRELQIDPTNAEARRRLDQVEQEIAVLRVGL